MSAQQLKKIRDDPVIFAKHILNFEPFDYQQKWLRDNSRRVMACCGRQVGKSTISAIKLIHFAITHPKSTSIIVSATLRQSMETFDKVLGFVLDSPLRHSILYKSRTKVVFKNRARVICLPCGRYGYSLRGLTVHFAVLDEAAFMPEDVISNVVFPMLATTNGSLWMLTTPWSKDHITYRAFMDVKGWSVYHLPSKTSPLVKKEFLDEQFRLIGEERFRMEYLAEFVDDARAYFPMTLLRKCIHICDELPCEFCKVYNDLQNNVNYCKTLFAGYDPGGRDSYAAVIVLDKQGERFAVRACIQEKIETTGEDPRFYTRFTLKISDMHKSLRFAKVGVDQTGLGGPILEHMIELDLPVKGFKLTNPVKEDLASRAKIILEQIKIDLPNDLALLNSLNCIEFERTRAGGFTFSHRSGTYDDLGWALMIALRVAAEYREGGGIVVGT